MGADYIVSIYYGFQIPKELSEKDEEILENAINIFGVQSLELLDDIYWTSFAKAIIKASRGEE